MKFLHEMMLIFRTELESRTYLQDGLQFPPSLASKTRPKLSASSVIIPQIIETIQMPDCGNTKPHCPYWTSRFKVRIDRAIASILV